MINQKREMVLSITLRSQLSGKVRSGAWNWRLKCVSVHNGEEWRLKLTLFFIKNIDQYGQFHQIRLFCQHIIVGTDSALLTMILLIRLYSWWWSCFWFLFPTSSWLTQHIKMLNHKYISHFSLKIEITLAYLGLLLEVHRWTPLSGLILCASSTQHNSTNRSNVPPTNPSNVQPPVVLHFNLRSIIYPPSSPFLTYNM